jgi:hypothetical protein
MHENDTGMTQLKKTQEIGNTNLMGKDDGNAEKSLHK